MSRKPAPETHTEFAAGRRSPSRSRRRPTSHVDDSLATAEAHYRAGRLPAAIRAAKQALEIEANQPVALRLLGAIAHRLGKGGAAVELMNRAVEVKPNLARTNIELGNILMDQRKTDEAAIAFKKGVALAPGDAIAHYLLGNALLNQGNLADSEAAFRQSLAIEPGYANAYYALADLYLQKGDPRAALEACESSLALTPGNGRTLGLKAIALDELGDRDGMRTLLDFDRLIGRTQVKPPGGFGSLAAFNDALEQQVRSHPTLSFEPAHTMVYGGWETQNLTFGSKGPLADLETAIRQEIDAYLGSFRSDPPPAFLAGRPRRWQFHVWSTILEARGHIERHVHPQGWLSGTYYVRVPEVVATPCTGHAGWIEFNRPEARFKTAEELELRLIQPEEGMMLLFPSYFFHRVIPSGSDEERISITFDIVPDD